MPFGRKRPPESPTEAEPEQPQTAEAPASEQLAALLAERTEIERELAEHREVRQQWLADGGDLNRIVELGSEDGRLKLRAEQLEALLPEAQEAVQCERAAQRDAHWQELVPNLDQAMQDTVDAIRAYDEASERYRKLHLRATQAGYDPELREHFITPPHAQINPWVFSTFVTTVEQCLQRRTIVKAMATAPPVVFDAAALFDLPAIERFTPRRTDPRAVEAISPLAEPVAIRVLHGPLRTSGMNFGIARMHVGEVHVVPARAAYLLTASGCAERVDETATAAA